MYSLRYPVIVLNFKAYRESIGVRAVRLARIAEKVSQETGVEIVAAPQHLDLPKVVEAVSIPVFSQHVDPHELGSWTGSLVVEALKEAGAAGSLVNHSEKQLRLADISRCVARLRDVGLLSLLCTNEPSVSAAGAALQPDMIAVEPPELIGTGIPVSRARPEVVTESVEIVKKVSSRVHVLCGAGISSPEDVAAAIKLGSEGVLLSSAYVRSKDPERLLTEMAQAAVNADSA